VIEIGTQGWNYEAWVGPFYPPRTRVDDFLALYARLFDTVEVDATFYAPPTDAATRSWCERTPERFSFAIKLVRSITHERRLRDAAPDLALFCERARALGPRLAAVLVQLPPDFTIREFGALETFLAELPSDIRFAVEFRDRSWFVDRTLDLLERYRVALALVDGEWVPRDLVLEHAERATADFAYARWMGSRAITDHSHVQIARDAELAEWAAVLGRVERNVSRVLAYFSNFFQGHAPASANALKRLVGQTPGDPDSLVRQPSLF
jgi:uncharacterized protein YecE (DUF72 family)